MNILIKTTGSEDYLFLTYENEGVKEYYLNGRATEKDEGNNIYRKVKNGDMGRITGIVHITEDNKEDMIEYYLKSYDRYVDYIDDGRQYASQQRINRRVHQYAELIDKCIKSRDEKVIRKLFHKYLYGWEV